MLPVTSPPIQPCMSSLRKSAPESTLAYLQHVASRNALWIGLFALLLLARWARETWSQAGTRSD